MFTLDQVVPWGRSFAEYRGMFALSDADLRGRILGCADGPASFNAEATRRGIAVISADPLYRFDGEAIRERVTATKGEIMEQMRSNMHDYVWDHIRSLDELGRLRMETMEAFLADYDAGKREGRYVDAELPALPFPDGYFDLAVCSHFLFLYSEHLAEAFHRDSILELCRVAKEVRIFPLITLGGIISPHLPRVVDGLKGTCEISLENAPYEFRRGGNQVMRARKV